MQVRARITNVLPINESKNGFKWQEFICEYYEAGQARPDRVLLKLLGEDKIKTANLQIGDKYDINFGHYVSEFNGRCYNELKVFTIAPVKEDAETPKADKETNEPKTVAPTPITPQPVSEEAKENDLPF